MNGKYIWYTSFGSNMLNERFLSYILGGKSNITGKLHHGCRNKDLPLEKRAYHINHKLFFSGRSRTWDEGGVAFIETKKNPEIRTPAKSYLISENQFLDILCQENGISPYAKKFRINFKEIERTGISGQLGNLTWYNVIIFTGKIEGYSSFTFTGFDNEKTIFSEPGELYLKTIIRGLIETFNYTEREIKNTLKDAGGIKNTPLENRLDSIIENTRLI